MKQYYRSLNNVFFGYSVEKYYLTMIYRRDCYNK